MDHTTPLRLLSVGLPALTLFLMSPKSLHANDGDLNWQSFPVLPPAEGQTVQPGVAGPFAGFHNGVILVAGGANFPDKMPWEGGTKTWWDDIWLWEGNTPASGRWLADTPRKLPRRIGYGVSVSTPEGIVCAGGNDPDRCYADVFMLSWDASSRELRRTELPPMPKPLAMMAGAYVGTTLYVAAGQHSPKDPTPSSAFWALDLSKRHRPAEFAWKELPSWPGPARLLPVAAAGKIAGADAFFLFSGRLPKAGQPTEMLSDAFAFDTASGRWRSLPRVGGGNGHCVMAGSAWTASSGEILVFGGDRGDLFLELEKHDLAIAKLKVSLATLTAGDKRAAVEQQIKSHHAAKLEIYAAHPGFGREVFAYDPRTNAWKTAARSPVPPQVTTVAVPWQRSVVITSGEIRPGVRTREIVCITPATEKR